MTNVNDLIGLKYRWGHKPGDGSGFTDCFQLACEVHRRLGLRDFSDKFAWAYTKYDEETFSPRLLARWLLENGTRTTTPQPGSVMLLSGSATGALGTYIDAYSVLFIDASSAVVRASLDGAGHLFWMKQ